MNINVFISPSCLLCEPPRTSANLREPPRLLCEPPRYNNLVTRSYAEKTRSYAETESGNIEKSFRNMLKIICSYLPLTGLPTLSGYTALSVSADLTVAKCYKLNLACPLAY